MSFGYRDVQLMLVELNFDDLLKGLRCDVPADVQLLWTVMLIITTIEIYIWLIQSLVFLLVQALQS